MTSSVSLRTAILVAAGTLLLGAGAQAGPMPTHMAAMKSMVGQDTTQVRWVGGYRGGYGYRDRDHDGVPNRYDRAPNNPYRN